VENLSILIAIGIMIWGCMRAVKGVSPRAHSILQKQGKKALRASGKGAWKAAKSIFRRIVP